MTTKTETQEYVMLASGRVCKLDHVETGTSPEGGTVVVRWTKCGLDAWGGPCAAPVANGPKGRKKWTPGEPCWLCFDRSEFK